MRRVHPAVKKVWRLAGLSSPVMFGVLAGFIEFAILRRIDSWPVRFPIVAPIVFLFALILTQSFVAKQYEAWRYQLTDKDLIIKWGVLWRTVRFIPREAIQHLDINQGPVDRRYDLVKVVIYTAGQIGSVGEIPGLTSAEAEELRTTILGLEPTTDSN